MTDTVDMKTLAHFSLLEGAGRVISAFSAIPEGALREASIVQLEAIAAQYRGSVLDSPTAPPVAQGVARVGGPVDPTQKRVDRLPPTESREAKIVKLRMDGVPPSRIAQEVGAHVSTVFKVLKEARKAGVPLPKKAKAEAPQAKNWHVDFNRIDNPNAAKIVVRAAAGRSLTPQAYLDRRQLALELAQRGHGYAYICRVTGETDFKTVSAWLSIARAAGFNVPYVTKVTALDSQVQPVAPAPQAAAPTPIFPRIYPPLTELSKSTYAAMMRAADASGISVEAYDSLREQIVQLRIAGRTQAEISKITGEGAVAVKDILKRAKQLGAVYPKLKAA